jgi:polyhydroxyalkanoate synthase
MDRPKIPIDLILAKLAEEAQQRLEKARDILLGPLDTDIGATPYEVVYQEDRVRLKHYEPAVERAFETPLLLVHALFNRDTMLDLQPDRSIVQSLLKEGVEVYSIDWGSPSRKDQFLTLDDHINGYLDNVVEVIRRRHRLPAVNLMGICMGGTFTLIYAALHPEKVKSLITTVAPAHFATDKGLLHIWMKEIDADRLVDAFGNLPGNLLNSAFLLLNPARLLLDKYLGFMEHMDNKEFVENFIRMEKWIFDSADIPGETLRQLIKDLYQQNLLIQGQMEVGGSRVDLRQVTMPLLNIYGRYDHLVPPEACELLTQTVGSPDTEDICLDTGHIGIYVSSRFHKELIPKIADWLSARNG